MIKTTQVRVKHYLMQGNTLADQDHTLPDHGHTLPYLPKSNTLPDQGHTLLDQGSPYLISATHYLIFLKVTLYLIILSV